MAPTTLLRALLILLATILTVVPAAAGTKIVQLRYSEPAVKKPKCVGEGLTGRMTCVEKDSVPGGGASGAEDPNPIASAELTVVLRAYVEILDDGSFVARIKVERSNLVIIGNMRPQSQNDVRSDARLVKERLNVWRRSLDVPEMARLIVHQPKVSIRLLVRRPYFGLKKLKHPGFTAVKVFLQPEGGKLPMPKWLKRILKLEEERNRLATIAMTARQKVIFTKDDIDIRKDAISRMDSIFTLFLFKWHPTIGGGFWDSFKGHYQIHPNVAYLERQYYSEFIRYKASRGESTYTNKEMYKWIVPREKVYIGRLEKRLPVYEKAAYLATQRSKKKKAEHIELTGKWDRKLSKARESDKNAVPKKGRSHLLDK